MWYQKAKRGRAEGEEEQILHPLVDVDEIVAAGAAVLHVLAGVDAERDAAAREHPGCVETREVE